MKQAPVVPMFHSRQLRLYGKNVRNAYAADWSDGYDLSPVSVR